MTEAWGFKAIFAQGCPSVRPNGGAPRGGGCEGPSKDSCCWCWEEAQGQGSSCCCPGTVCPPECSTATLRGMGRTCTEGSVCYHRAHKPHAGPSSFPPVGLRGATKRDTAASTTLGLQSRSPPLHSLRNLGPFHFHSLP